MNKNSDTNKLTLESDLEADTMGVTRDSLINEFSQQINAIKTSLNLGVAPKEYQEMTTVIEAIEMASETIDWVWQNYHSNN
jgi:glycerol dehydrogenase-like iron-containing ADH family enzyme